jgi:5-histidylcysteine sulfoxide synthase/putative 4-mercaptohistidine N1-methyltranferase
MIITKNISLNGDDVEQKRAEIKEYFLKTYELYEKLFNYLSCDESYYQRADNLRHPLIFYFGHTASFFVNKLILAKIIQKRINPRLESIFAVGVDEMSWDDLDEKHYEWPTVIETKAYRDEVKIMVLSLIEKLPLTLPISWTSPFWAIMMGIEHERIHLETSAVLIRQLPLTMLQQNRFFKECNVDHDIVTNEFISIPDTTISLGKSKDSDLYGWDNEYGNHKSFVERFETSKYLVSNAEYLEFVKDKGYEDDSFWCEEGKKWKDYTGVKRPRFWAMKDDKYYLRTIAGIISLPLSWPVEVNNLEAQAFCRYKAKKLDLPIRLPSEDEYHAIREFSKVDELDFKANINLEEFCSPNPIDMFEHNGLFDVVGNVWQHTSTPIYGFDGFKVHPWYDDFSTPTFDDKHNLLMGGSWISTGNEIQKSARYAFRRHFYQFAGIRYINSNKIPKNYSAIYEKDKEISKVLDASYDGSYLGMPNYYVKLAEYLKTLMRDKKRSKALDMGCGGGRCGLELTSDFDLVHAVDLTARVISNSVFLKQNGHLRYAMRSEGDFEELKEIQLSNYNFKEHISKIEFWQGDLANLKPFFNEYDLVILNDILTKTYDPKGALENIHNIINQNGILVLATADDWDTTYTSKKYWLGGIRENGEQIFSKDHIESILSHNFTLLDNETHIHKTYKLSNSDYKTKMLRINAWIKN